MSKDLSVNVHHITRVEGHGNIVLDVKKGEIKQIQWQVPEAPRFFEAMLRGRHYDELTSNYITYMWYLQYRAFPCKSKSN